jgi:putative holliday junction resolvase
MGRLLGIDYGEKRIGLALSDPLQIIASPFDTIQRTSLAADLDRLAALIDEQEVEALVVGAPLHTHGAESEMGARARLFVAALVERRPRPVHWVDERYSSLEADDLLRSHSRDWRKRKPMLDKMAAQIILRGFMDGRDRRRAPPPEDLDDGA